MRTTASGTICLMYSFIYELVIRQTKKGRQKGKFNTFLNLPIYISNALISLAYVIRYYKKTEAANKVRF